MNRGLDLARGDLIVRMDADDISVPGRIAAQLRWMQSRPDAVMCGTQYEMFGAVSGRVRMPTSDTACRQRLLLSSSHCGASIMLRRRVLDEHDVRYDPSLHCAEDYELITRIARLGDIGNLPMVGYRYRIHQAQASSRHRESMREVHLSVAARHAQHSGARALQGSVLRSLLWPDSGGVLRVAWVSGTAAARALLRGPGIETARFCIRTVIENVLEARRRRSRAG